MSNGFRDKQIAEIIKELETMDLKQVSKVFAAVKMIKQNNNERTI